MTKMRRKPASVPCAITRREALRTMGCGFGTVGLAATLGESALRAAPRAIVPGPLDPKPPHFAAKAKQVIFLMLNGGLSQVDTFDPKPMLDKYDGQPMPGGNLKTLRQTGNLMRSPFPFQQYGQSGIEVTEIFSQVGRCIDDICVIRSMHTDIPNHLPGLFMMNSGSVQVGRPSMGSWLTYGLGTENQSLPGFIVLCPGTPIGGSPLWNSSFLPAVYQGTHIRTNETDPQKLIRFIHNKQLNSSDQRRQLDLLADLNRSHLKRRRADSQLETAIQTMEIAFRMQAEAPDVFDISKESEATREHYGDTDFAKSCLMARRLVERGVRVVQIYFGNLQPWDNHEDIMVHRANARVADKPIAALLKDLKSRGLLEETLVIIGSEFGRSPTVEISSNVQTQNGRDHNSLGFSVLLAGGGVKGGMTYGATDDFGFKAIENPVHVHDLHATILRLLGFDHTKLTYSYSGLDFRLTDVHGKVVKEIIA